MILHCSRRGSGEVGLDTLNIKVSINNFIEKGFLINQMSRIEGDTAYFKHYGDSLSPIPQGG